MTDVEIVSFQSAQERDAAFASGAIDALHGRHHRRREPRGRRQADHDRDDHARRRPEPGPLRRRRRRRSRASTTLSALADVPVGTSSATIQEYVLDGLMAEAGVADVQVKVEEVKKVPVRFELLMAGKLKAAALPEPFLTLAEQGGAPLVGDRHPGDGEPVADGAGLLGQVPRRAGRRTTAEAACSRRGTSRSTTSTRTRRRCYRAARREGAAARVARDHLQGQHVPDGAGADQGRGRRGARVDEGQGLPQGRRHLRPDLVPARPRSSSPHPMAALEFDSIVDDLRGLGPHGPGPRRARRSRWPTASRSRSSARAAAASPRCCCSPRGCSRRPPGAVRVGGRAGRRAAARDRAHPAGLRAAAVEDGRGQRRARPQDPRRRRAASCATRAARCARAASGSPTSRARTRPSCRAACASASRSPARSRSTPTCC